MHEPETDRQELDDLHDDGVLTDAEFEDAETRLPAEPAPPLAVSPPDAQPAPDPTLEPTTPATDDTEAHADAALTPAEQELAAVGTLNSDPAGTTQALPEDAPPEPVPAAVADVATLAAIAAHWDQVGPWAGTEEASSDAAPA